MQDVDPKMPVLIGAGQCVRRPDNGAPKSPIAMMADAARLAVADTEAAGNILPAIDNITVTRFIVDAPSARGLPFGKYLNPPKTLAKRLGISPSHLAYGPTGGNSPQLLINLMAERIAQGQHQLVLLAGSECIHSLVRALKAGKPLDWQDNNDKADMEDLGKGEKSGSSETETAHGIHLPINAYPMFENAIRKNLGQTISEHQDQIGQLMAPFSEIAVLHPQAWFPKARLASEIAQAGDNNRYVGFPYTKYMNAIMQVDQAAAIIMTNAATAEKLGVPREQWVFLHGCADVNDIWLMSERIDFHSSPAIRLMGESALNMAGWNINDIDWLDIYSCFPSAVQIARDELGIAADDPRALTITGGLPYFGGCGNNYAMHSVATMISQLRRSPGSKGLCTANGWFLTKHSIGLYSTAPPQGRLQKQWQRAASDQLQAQIDALKHPEAIAKAEGRARIDTYTVAHNRQGAQQGIVIGSLIDNDRRFTAHITDETARDRLMVEDHIGCIGRVSCGENGINIFTPEG